MSAHERQRLAALHEYRLLDAPFVHVRDASLDPTDQDNPWVTRSLAKVRFYASAPLVTPQGHALAGMVVSCTPPDA